MYAVVQPQQLFFNLDSSSSARTSSVKKAKTESSSSPAALHKQQTLDWLQETFTIDEGRAIPKHAVFEEYSVFCKLNGWQVGSAATCGRLVHRAFPKVVCARKGGRGSAVYHYKNLYYKNAGNTKQTVTPLVEPKKEERKMKKQKLMTFDEFPHCNPYLLPQTPQTKVQTTQTPSFYLHNNQPATTTFFEDVDSPYSSPSSSAPHSPEQTQPNSCWTDQWLSFAEGSSSPFSSSSEEEEDLDFGNLLSLIQNEDYLQTHFDDFYRRLLNSLCQIERNPIDEAKKVIQQFWSEEFPLLSRERSIEDCLFYEERGMSWLLDRLYANPSRLASSNLADFLSSIATQLPLIVQLEAMRVLSPDNLFKQMTSWSSFAQCLYRKAMTLNGHPFSQQPL